MAEPTLAVLSLSRQGSSTNVFFSSVPSFDTIVNRLCGLWAGLKKLVSQSDGSLLAEGQGHISMEVACEDLAPTPHSPLSHF